MQVIQLLEFDCWCMHGRKLSRCASLEIRISDFGTTYFVFPFTERRNIRICSYVSWSGE